MTEFHSDTLDDVFGLESVISRAGPVSNLDEKLPSPGPSTPSPAPSAGGAGATRGSAAGARRKEVIMMRQEILLCTAAGAWLGACAFLGWFVGGMVW